MAGRNNRPPGKFTKDGITFHDHGDPDVEAFWQDFYGLPEAIRRHASLGGDIPPQDAYSVPPEYVNAGRVPDSWFVCEDILAATESGSILE